MDAVIVIPSDKFSVFSVKTISTMIEGLEISCDLNGGFLLFKSGNNTFTLTIRIATHPQHMVDLCLREVIPPWQGRLRCVLMEHILHNGGSSLCGFLLCVPMEHILLRLSG